MARIIIVRRKIYMRHKLVEIYERYTVCNQTFWQLIEIYSAIPWKIISQITYTPSNNGFYHTDKLFTTADVRRDADLFTTANFSPRIFIRWNLEDENERVLSLHPRQFLTICPLECLIISPISHLFLLPWHALTSNFPMPLATFNNCLWYLEGTIPRKTQCNCMSYPFLGGSVFSLWRERDSPYNLIIV